MPKSPLPLPLPEACSEEALAFYARVQAKGWTVAEHPTSGHWFLVRDCGTDQQKAAEEIGELLAALGVDEEQTHA